MSLTYAYAGNFRGTKFLLYSKLTPFLIVYFANPTFYVFTVIIMWITYSKFLVNLVFLWVFLFSRPVFLCFLTCLMQSSSFARKKNITIYPLRTYDISYLASFAWPSLLYLAT